MFDIKKGAPVCFMLAFGQFYLAEVTAVYDDQEVNGGPTIDLVYNGNPIMHVTYSPLAQQPYSYCMAADPGWPGTLQRPEPASEPEKPAKGEAVKAEKA